MRRSWLRRREPPETACGWCGDPFTPDDRADPEPFCSDHCAQWDAANPDYAPGAAGHDGVLHTPLAYAPEGDPDVPQVACPDCHHTGPALHSREEAAQLAALHDQLIHRGRPTADLTPDTPAPDTTDPPAAADDPGRSGWERGPDVYRNTPEQQHHDQDVDALLTAALDRPRRVDAIEPEDGAGRDWHDRVDAVEVDRGEELAR